MVKRGPEPAYSDLAIRIIRKVMDMQKALPHYNELFKGLRCSKTTFDKEIKGLVRNRVLEYDYETKSFKVSDRGLNLIAPWGQDKDFATKIHYRFPDQYTEFLLTSNVFRDKQDAVKATIEFGLGYFQRYVIEELSRTRKENPYLKQLRQYLLEDIKAISKKHRFAFKPTELKQRIPWDDIEISQFLLMFSTDKQTSEGALTGSFKQRMPDGTFEKRETGLGGLKNFLLKRYPSFDEHVLIDALEKQRRLDLK